MVEINGKKINLPRPEMMRDPRYIAKQADRVMFEILSTVCLTDNSKIAIREIVLNALAKVVSDTNYMNVWQEYQRIDQQIEAFHKDIRASYSKSEFYRPDKKGSQD